MREIFISDRTLASKNLFFCPTTNGSLKGVQTKNGLFCEASVAQYLIGCGVDYIDLGFWRDKDRAGAVINRLPEKKKDLSKCTDSAQLPSLPLTTSQSRYVVRALIGEDTLEDILIQLEETGSSTVRVCFDSVGIEWAVRFCQKLVANKITVWLHPLNLFLYTTEEFKKILNLFADIDIGALFLSNEGNECSIHNVERLLPVGDECLGKGVCIGISFAESETCSFAITEKILAAYPERNFIVDTVVYNEPDSPAVSLLYPTLFALNEPHQKYKPDAAIGLIEFLLPTMPSSKQVYENIAMVAGKKPADAQYFFIKNVPLWETFDFLMSFPQESLQTFSTLELDKALSDFRHEKVGLGIVVPTKDRSDEILFFLGQVSHDLMRYGIDVTIFDSSEDNLTQEVVKHFDSNNIIYKRYVEKNNQRTLDYKICEAIVSHTDKYHYIWPLRDRNIPRLALIYNKLSLFAWYKFDFVVVYPHFKSWGTDETSFYNDPVALLRHLCGEMTSLGSVIYSSHFAKTMIEKHPIDAEKNWGLWVTIALFAHIGEIEFKAAYFATNSFAFLPMERASFWIRSDTLLWLWTCRWPTMVRMLPSIYDSEKEALIKCQNWTVQPFDPQLLALNKASGGFSPREVINHRKQLAMVTDIPFWRLFVFSLIPKRLLQKYQRKQKSSKKRNLFTRITQAIPKRCKENWKSIKSSHRKQYSGKDYGKYEDCFARHEHIPSYLLSGNLKSVERPWITIIIPTYKRLALLKDTLQSVLQQTPVDFEWDIVVVDNESYEGEKNETQRYIESLDNPRILYYRHQKGLGAEGNFNRGVKLARGEWVSFVHDDDLLISRYLERIGKRIKAFENVTDKKLGVIWGTYHVFKGAELDKNLATKEEIAVQNYLICTKSDTGKMNRVSHEHLVFTGDLGVGAPTTGTLFRRAAYIEFGGIQSEAFNISSDITFFYKIMTKYAVYKNSSALGFYRWHSNASRSKTDQILCDLYDFREYVYRRSLFTRLAGLLLRQEAFIFLAKRLWLQEYETLHGFNLNDYRHIMELHENKFRSCLARGIRKTFVWYRKWKEDVRFPKAKSQMKKI